jgi:hypothetical protein
MRVHALAPSALAASLKISDRVSMLCAVLEI